MASPTGMPERHEKNDTNEEIQDEESKQAKSTLRKKHIHNNRALIFKIGKFSTETHNDQRK